VHGEKERQSPFLSLSSPSPSPSPSPSFSRRRLKRRSLKQGMKRRRLGVRKWRFLQELSLLWPREREREEKEEIGYDKPRLEIFAIPSVPSRLPLFTWINTQPNARTRDSCNERLENTTTFRFKIDFFW